MAIVTLDDYIGSVKQIIPFSRTTTRTTVANGWFSMFDVAGNPGSGTLNPSNTANGTVPIAGATGATNGYPFINFTSGLGYLATVDFGCTVACRMAVYDCLFKAGAYAYNSGTTNLSSQPSYSGRIPNGTDYSGLEVWIQVTTAFVTGTTWHAEVTYDDQDGNHSHSTVSIGSTTAANLTLGRMYQLPLQAGDTGIQKVTSVVVTTGGMTAGAFNVMVMRPLWNGRVAAANGGDNHGIGETGLPQVWGGTSAGSALEFLINADSTSSGLPDLEIEIASN